MSIKVPNKYLVFGIIGTIVALIVLGWCLGSSHNKSILNQLKTTLAEKNRQIYQYVVEIDNNKLYISQVEQEIKILSQAKKDGDITQEALRKLRIKTLNELTKVNATVSVLRDSVAHNGKIIIVHDTIGSTVSKNALLLPFEFGDKNRFIDLSGRFNERGIMSYKLTVPADFSVLTGLDKDKKYTAIIETINPYIKINSVTAIKLDVPKVHKWGIGLVGGYGLVLSNPVRFSPFIGIGISRNIIRF